METKFLGGQL